MIPCQNCTNLYKDFKLHTDFKGVRQVKTITVIEASDTKLCTNELDIPEKNKSINKIYETDINSSFEKYKDHEILKRSVISLNFTRKQDTEPEVRWRKFDKVRHPIKRDIPSNTASVRVKKRKLKDHHPLENKSKEASLLSQTEIITESYEIDDQNGTEAQHKLMTQAIIQKPNGIKVVLQDKAYSEPIRKNIKYDDFDKTERALKTNINFYDDLPDYNKPYSHLSSYDSDSYNYMRPKEYGDSKPYKFSRDHYEFYPKHKFHDDYHDVHQKYKPPRFNNFDEEYHEHTPKIHEEYNSHHKYKPSVDTYPKYKSPKPAPVNDMIDVMPDHDAQYEYVPIEKDENGNGKIKQDRGPKRGKYNRGGYYDSGHYRRPSISSYDSEEEDIEGGGYGYSSLPQKSYYNNDKSSEYYSKPTNIDHSYNRQSLKSKYKEDTDNYPKYEKVTREYDYDVQGYASEEKQTYHGRKNHSRNKIYEKPLTLKVNIDDNGEDEESDEHQDMNDYDYASRNGNTGRIAARVTKVPKTLEEYHKLHRTWEKRPPKSKKTKSHKKNILNEPKKKSRPVRPKTKHSSRQFPPVLRQIEKPHVSYEFEGPNSHVVMDFVTPAYDEHSEAFKGSSAENDESDESRPRTRLKKITPDIDSVFDKFYDASFKQISTKKPYKIKRLPAEALHSREEDSAEFSKNIIRDITPKLNQRDKEDLYNKLRNDIGLKKYKRPQDSSYYRDDILKELGLDFESEGKRGNYNLNYGVDKSRILIPKVGKKLP